MERARVKGRHLPQTPSEFEQRHGDCLAFSCPDCRDAFTPAELDQVRRGRFIGQFEADCPHCGAVMDAAAHLDEFLSDPQAR